MIRLRFDERARLAIWAWVGVLLFNILIAERDTFFVLYHPIVFVAMNTQLVLPIL